MGEVYGFLILVWFLLVMFYSWQVSNDAWLSKYMQPDSIFIRILGISFLMLIMGAFLGLMGSNY
jgi:hypothetical protein